ncbi:hypothetical protein INR49_018060 [Caranx melampygus]|nr:hypothetical protein INR49_018060 [Caranx melampygus]
MYKDKINQMQYNRRPNNAVVTFVEVAVVRRIKVCEDKHCLKVSVLFIPKLLRVVRHYARGVDVLKRKNHNMNSTGQSSSTLICSIILSNLNSTQRSLSSLSTQSHGTQPNNQKLDQVTCLQREVPCISRLIMRRVAKEEEDEEEAREEVSEKRRGTSASLAAGSTGGEGDLLFESPCNVKRFLALATEWPVWLAEASTERESKRELELVEQGKEPKVPLTC